MDDTNVAKEPITVHEETIYPKVSDERREATKVEQSEAIENAQNKLILALTEKLAEVSKASKKDTTNRQILFIALPVVLSSILAFMINRLESNTQKMIDYNSQILSTRLTLMEDFSKQQLTAYVETYHRVAFLADALRNAAIDSERATQAFDSLAALDNSYRLNRLFMSDNLVKEISGLWELGKSIPTIRNGGDANICDVVAKISSIEKVMKEDLHVQDLDVILGSDNLVKPR